MNKRIALALLIVGLMLVTVTSVLARKYELNDSLRGFFTGLGIGIELIAAVMLVRQKRMSK